MRFDRAADFHVVRLPVYGVVLWSLRRVGNDLLRALALIYDINSKTN